MTTPRFARTRLAAAAALLVGTVPLAGAPAAAGPTRTAWQIDGNRGADIAAGLPFYDRGALVVLPSGSGGPRAGAAVTITGEDLPRQLDFIGGSLASGDVEGDGFAETITSGLELTPLTVRRALAVIPGGPDGPVVSEAEVISAPADGFGGTVVAADLDRDGLTDVVAQSGTADGPQVTILWGGADGLTMERATHLRVTGQRRFGQLLAVGNVDGDRRTDLVAGQTGQIPDNEEDQRVRGFLNVCEIGPARSVRCADPLRSPAGARTILVADVIGGNAEEVLLGEPKTNDRDDTVNRPRVWLYRGTDSGIVAPPVKIDRSSPGVPGTASEDSAWGSALAAGDLDRDGKEELAIGAPGEGGGRVTVLWGNRRGPGRSGRDVTFSQATRGIPGTSQAGDGFGGGLSVLDATADGRLDLIVGSPGEDDRRGAITVVPWRDGALRPGRSVRIEAAELGLDPSRGEISLGQVLGQ